jgi:membrane-bound lytic murein transglycosylase D
MLFNNSLIRLTGCVILAATLLGGCSRNEVKKGRNIPDGTQVQSTTAPDKPRKKASRGSQYDTLWDRLFALYALPHVDHPDIDRELSWFANHPAYLERAQNRAEPFLYSIVKLVEKKKIPGELALLPIVESAFQPNVVSSAKAAGIWQFIPSTGTNYGLKRSQSYDGRRDVYASTKAALKYLRKLHGDFGDWLLAIAAYNCGEGAVARAIRRNQAAGLPTDFWSLNLPQETRAYVPKLLAVSRLFADAEKYGISLKDLPNMAKYKPVKVNNHLDLALAADAAGISLDQLYALNPGFKGQYADVDGSYHLYIPANKKAAEFREEVERLSMSRRSYMPRDTYQETEAVPVPPSAFQSFRREFSTRGTPAPRPSPMGGRFIPMSYSPGDDAAPAPAVREPVRRPPPMRSASSERSIPVAKAERASYRPASTPDVVKTSRRADVAESARPAASEGSKSGYHSVQKGETLYAVARKHSVNVAQLAKWNNIPITTEVQAGQKLVLTESASAKKSGSAVNAAKPKAKSSVATKSKMVEGNSNATTKQAAAETKKRSTTQASASGDIRKLASASTR